MASGDWRTSPRSTAASPWRPRARAESSPDSRGRSCGLCPRSLGDSAPFAEETVDIGFAGVWPEADPEETIGNIRWHSHGGEHRTALHRAGRAGASCGNGNSSEVELDQQ